MKQCHVLWAALPVHLVVLLLVSQKLNLVVQIFIVYRPSILIPDRWPRSRSSKSSKSKALLCICLAISASFALVDLMNHIGQVRAKGFAFREGGAPQSSLMEMLCLSNDDSEWAVSHGIQILVQHFWRCFKQPQHSWVTRVGATRLSLPFIYIISSLFNNFQHFSDIFQSQYQFELFWHAYTIHLATSN